MLRSIKGHPAVDREGVEDGSDDLADAVVAPSNTRATSSSADEGPPHGSMFGPDGRLNCIDKKTRSNFRAVAHLKACRDATLPAYQPGPSGLAPLGTRLGGMPPP
jgi:hypothetical protein